MEYGNVPQNRERIYIVAFLDEEKSKEFEWENLYNGEECKTHFLIFNTAGMIVLVPKRFLSDEQIPQLRKIMKVMMQSKFKTKYKIN